MSRYLITLTPVGRFFFGGDMTFKIGDDKDYNEEFSSYIIESGKMPQQTSLLGMLRFLILSNDADAFDHKLQKIIDTDRARQIIGSRSFTVSEHHTGNNFGLIKSISPCFLQYKPKDKGDWGLMDIARKDKDLKIEFGESDAFYNGKRLNVLDVTNTKDGKPYTSKSGLTSGFELYGKPLSENEIYVIDQRIGINRDITTGMTEEDSLFKQIGYRFKDEAYRFAFTAEVDMDLTPYNGQIVSVGGDNSIFSIGITHYIETEADNTDGDTIMLLSPSYIEEMTADFAITEVIPFRFIKTSIDDTHFSSPRLKNKSEKYHLYKQGSIFYFTEKEVCRAFANKLKSYKDFYQIGYNHYKIFNR